MTGDGYVTAVREIRIVAMLDALEALGETPVELIPLHMIAYFSDALAPVWKLPILDKQVLKQARPYFPAFQEDLDRLVGIGLVAVSDVEYLRDGERSRLNARYELNRSFADRILALARSFPERANDLHFVKEVVNATSGLAVRDLSRVGTVDATYSDPMIDMGGLIEIARDPGEPANASARVALRFGELLAEDGPLSTAEMINLYVRRLYARMEVA